MKEVINSPIKKIDGLKITVPDSFSGTAYNTTKYSKNSEKNAVTDTFVNVKIETNDGKKMQERMFQDDPLQTIKNDIKKIENGNIRDTELKNVFTKIMLEKNAIYDVNVNGCDEKGKYIGPNPFNNRQLRFDVNGERVNTDKEKINIKINEKKYNI